VQGKKGEGATGYGVVETDFVVSAFDSWAVETGFQPGVFVIAVE